MKEEGEKNVRKRNKVALLCITNQEEQFKWELPAYMVEYRNKHFKTRKFK